MKKISEKIDRKATEGISIPFIGREKEWKRLQVCREKVLQGKPGLVVIEGEAGIGKSRLVEEFGRWCRGRGDRFLKGTAVAHQGGDPYGPFSTPIQRLVGIEPGDKGICQRKKLISYLQERGADSDVAAAFAEALLSEGLKGRVYLEHPDLRRHLLWEGTCQILRLAASERPVCLFIDDLQWASSSVFELLDYLLDRLDESRILLIGAYRVEEVNQGREGAAHPLRIREQIWAEKGVSRFALGRLSEEAVRELAIRVLDRDDSPTVERLCQGSEGLPLLVVEYLKVLRQQRNGSIDSLPTRVRQIIRLRLDRLNPEDRDLLRCAALLGERFDAELLATVMGAARARVLLRLMHLHETHQLVFPSGFPCYRFTHAKVREELSGELDPGLRRACCLAAAEALEGADKQDESRVFDLAYYFRDGGDVQRAARYHALAARFALQRQAGEEALRYARTAVELLEEGPPAAEELAAEVFTIAAQVAVRTTDRKEEALDYAQRALSTCRQSLLRADLYCLMADIHGACLGKSVVYRELLEKARGEIGEQTETVQMARVRFRLGRHQDFPRALAAAQEALEIFARTAPDDPEVYQVFTRIIHCLVRLDEVQAVEDYARRFQRWVEARGDVVELLSFYDELCEANMVLGRFSQVVELAGELLRLARGMRRPDLEGEQLFLLARTQAYLGDYEQAVDIGKRSGRGSSGLENAWCFEAWWNGRTGLASLAGTGVLWNCWKRLWRGNSILSRTFRMWICSTITPLNSRALSIYSSGQAGGRRSANIAGGSRRSGHGAVFRWEKSGGAGM